MTREQIEKQIRWSEIRLNYIGVPCCILHIVAIGVALYANSMSSVLFNATMLTYNWAVCIANVRIRRGFEFKLECLDVQTKLQRVRDLNPRKS